MFWYISDTEEVVGINNRRLAKIWNYDRYSALSVLRGHDDGPECITHSKLNYGLLTPATRGPVLVFTCGDDSFIRKWERLQLNTSIYSQEVITLPVHKVARQEDSEVPDKTKIMRKDIRKFKMEELKKKAQIKNNHYLTKLKEFKSLSANIQNDAGDKMNLTRQIELLSAETQKVFKRSLTMITSGAGKANPAEVARLRKTDLEENYEDSYGYIKKHSIAKMFYHEDLEFLICASNDGHICIDTYYFN